MIEIDVVYQPDHEPQPLRGDRPQLAWGYHPEHGNGWTLTYLEGTDDESGADFYFIHGDLLDVDYAVAQAQHWIEIVRRDRAVD